MSARALRKESGRELGTVADAFPAFERAFTAIAGAPRTRLQFRSVVARRWAQKVIVTVHIDGLPGGANELTLRVSRRVAEELCVQLREALGA